MTIDESKYLSPTNRKERDVANDATTRADHSPRLLIGATGAISVIDLPLYLMMLRRLKIEARVVLTPSADRIFPEKTLSYLCEVYREDRNGADHVSIARWADLFVVLPCTAHTLGLLAAGLAPGLLTATALAHRHPLLIFPIMNRDMWKNNAVQRNVQQLTKDGHSVIDPSRGVAYEVADRRDMEGLHLPHPGEVTAIVLKTLKERVAPAQDCAEAREFTANCRSGGQQYSEVPT